MFEKILKDDYYCYVYKDKLDNGQTIDFIFWMHDRNLFTIEMQIYSKRKKKSSHFLDTTGKCGLKGLHLARLVLICFIEFLEEITPIGESKQIVVGASDSKRMRIYKHYLGKLGFKYTRTTFGDMAMCLDVKGKEV